jgi:hypothetical protein
MSRAGPERSGVREEERGRGKERDCKSSKRGGNSESNGNKCFPHLHLMDKERGAIRLGQWQLGSSTNVMNQSLRPGTRSTSFTD